MIFAIAKLISGLTGWDISKVQRYVFWALLVLIAIVLISVGLWTYSCFHEEPKIDLETVDKINKGNEAEKKQEIHKVVVENQDVVSTVDNRTTIAETDIYERDKEIARKVNQVEKEVDAARQQGRDVTQDELKCLLIPENCSQ